MGAIFGIIILKNGTNSIIRHKELQRMSHSLKHRGPNYEAYHLEGKVGLGVRVLKDFDITCQPIQDREKTVCVVCDGQIQNFDELKKSKVEEDQDSCSNSEALLYLWKTHGSNFVKKLKGMFAIALYDKSKSLVLVATDKFGTKPVYYFVDDNRLIFASEIKAILATQTHWDVDYRAIIDFFIVGHPLNGKTFFKGVNRLLPGHMLLISGCMIRKLKYCDFEFVGKGEKLGESQTREHLQELLSKNVEKSLLANVPIGMALSGGVDSSLLTAIASKILRSRGKKLKTFTLVFPRYECDESRYARTIAKLADTEHHEVTHSPEDLVEGLSRFLLSSEEPYEYISTHIFGVIERASKHVKILLSGNGAGIIFGGISDIIWPHIQQCLIERRELRNYFFAAVRIIMRDALRRDFSSFFSFLELFLPSLASPFLVATLCSRDESFKKRFLSKDLNRELKGYYPSLIKHNIGKNLEPFDKATFYGLKEWLGMVLVTADKLSMACSISSIHCFMEQELAEYALSIHHSQKIKNLQKKYILKKVAEHFIPKRIIWRKKMALHMPTEVWFRKELKKFITDILTGSRTISREFFNQSFVEIILAEHIEGKRNHSDLLERLLSFEIWYRIFLDNTEGKINP
jgi:asparagine synthase (glutamine-hydrolysing)